MSDINEHDPFNEPKTAHPRARELMREPMFWDCVDEAAPFGSDEGSDAYLQVAIKRQRHPLAGHYDSTTLDAIARVVGEA